MSHVGPEGTAPRRTVPDRGRGTADLSAQDISYQCKVGAGTYQLPPVTEGLAASPYTAHRWRCDSLNKTAPFQSSAGLRHDTRTPHRL